VAPKLGGAVSGLRTGEKPRGQAHEDRGELPSAPPQPGTARWDVCPPLEVGRRDGSPPPPLHCSAPFQLLRKRNRGRRRVPWGWWGRGGTGTVPTATGTAFAQAGMNQPNLGLRQVGKTGTGCRGGVSAGARLVLLNRTGSG